MAAGRSESSPLWNRCSAPGAKRRDRVAASPPPLTEEAEHQIDDQELQRGGGEIATRPAPQPKRDRAEGQPDRPATGERQHQALRQRRRRGEKKIAQSPGEPKQR